MGLKGGDIRQLVVQGKELTPAAEADFEFSPSGIEVEGRVGGNGKSYGIGKRKPAYLKTSVLGDSESGVLEYLQEIEDTGNAVPASFTLASGDTYGGSLRVVGALAQKKDGSIDLEMQGDRLEKI